MEDPLRTPQTHNGLEDQGSPIGPRREEMVVEEVEVVVVEEEEEEEEDLQWQREILAMAPS